MFFLWKRIDNDDIQAKDGKEAPPSIYTRDSNIVVAIAVECIEY